jgi:hypothetical protein
VQHAVNRVRAQFWGLKGDARLAQRNAWLLVREQVRPEAAPPAVPPPVAPPPSPAHGRLSAVRLCAQFIHLADLRLIYAVLGGHVAVAEYLAEALRDGLLLLSTGLMPWRPLTMHAVPHTREYTMWDGSAPSPDPRPPSLLAGTAAMPRPILGGDAMVDGENGAVLRRSTKSKAVPSYFFSDGERDGEGELRYGAVSADTVAEMVLVVRRETLREVGWAPEEELKPLDLGSKGGGGG